MLHLEGQVFQTDRTLLDHRASPWQLTEHLI